MASTRVDSVLHDLELLQSNFQKHDLFEIGFSDIRKDFESLKLSLQFLKTFLLCARKWSNNEIYVDLRAFLSTIDVTMCKNGRDIQSLCHRSKSSNIHMEGVVKSLKPVVSGFRGKIKSFKQQVIEAYTALSQSSRNWLSDDELVVFIDSILQNLADLLTGLYFESMEDYNNDLHAQSEALEEKLRFLKNFIGFVKLFGVDHRELEDLLIHIQFVALNAARLSYMCLFYREDEQVRNLELGSMIKELVHQKCNPVDHQVYDTYIKVLKNVRTSKTSTLLQTKNMDKHIVRDFNGSLISSLWELMCNTSFIDSMKDQMLIFYEGLRFLRSTLRELEEKTDELDETIAIVLSEAGIVICSLYVNKVVGDPPDCCDMLVNINCKIKLIKAQITGSSMIESVPSNQTFKGQEVHKTYRLKQSRGKIPISHEVVVGIEDEAEKVIDRLVRGSDNLQIFPIVGMPGLGKTTLAKKIFSDPRILSYFHIRHWCTVSQVYYKKALLFQILCDDGKHSKMNEELKILSEDDLLEKLYKSLKGNRYLVVFDDVWDIRVWNDLGYAFPNDRNGSRILFTSRFSNVASEVKIGREPHNLRILDDGESWELLQKKVFGEEACPRELSILGKEIAGNCKGLPLTVVIIAGILASVEYDDWCEVANSLTSTIVYDTDHCKNTLELSYIHLPDYLKPCLLYFGAFREDQEIQAKKLMSLWIAEGFVQNTEANSLEDLAEEYILDLISRNLVTIAKQRSMGGVKACKIHDLLHEFCKTKSKEENVLQVLHEYDELSTFNEPHTSKGCPFGQRLSILRSQSYFVQVYAVYCC
ncbi:hypothetical protein ACH5RR_041434 [Cinchona calisaya]|uniref:Uncharacterized protein n=1 Tax=Cinchona calisaya TaxID=153742 RepID=A0ABD2XTP3_9GENT